MGFELYLIMNSGTTPGRFKRPNRILIGYWPDRGLNLARPNARQVTYPLHYDFGPLASVVHM